MGHLSHNKVKRLIESIVVVNNLTVGSLLKLFKDCLRLAMKSHVHYPPELFELLCMLDALGVTTRLLPARVQVHRDAFKSMRSSAVADHSLWTGHGVD